MNQTTLYSLPLTPYRDLQAISRGEGPLIPLWAEKREVYRHNHRTRYVVETTRLADALEDLHTLRSRGWDVSVQKQDLNGRAIITMAAGEARLAA